MGAVQTGALVRAAAMFATLALAVGCGGNGSAVDASIPDAAPPDAAPPDAGVDARVGPVQCRTSEDCIPLTGSGCFGARPGGVCASCGDKGDECPPGTECITGGTSGATECAYPCDDDGDCIAGNYCASIGYCQPRPCNELTRCPAPYTFCRETTAPLFECARPRCADGCPPPLSCPPGAAFCVEPP